MLRPIPCEYGAQVARPGPQSRVKCEYTVFTLAGICMCPVAVLGRWARVWGCEGGVYEGFKLDEA